MNLLNEELRVLQNMRIIYKEKLDEEPDSEVKEELKEKIEVIDTEISKDLKKVNSKQKKERGDAPNGDCPINIERGNTLQYILQMVWKRIQQRIPLQQANVL